MGAANEELMQGLSGAEEKIFVSIRLRPLNEKEMSRNDVLDWECINDDTVINRSNLSVSERSMYPTAYTYDRVFSPDCSTRQVYEEGAKKVALSVASGINSSVFAYGQTSSGKTYTMSGITEYTVADIYDHIERHKEKEFFLKFSAMEIYNESVRDLLSTDTTPLRLLDDPERGTIVERLMEETLRDWNHFKELLCACEAQRQIGETSLNEASSRSHQILRLTIESSAREFLGNDKSSTLAATVNFVDLAGSERASQSLSAGMRLKEGGHINRSLLTLGTVIRKLSKGRNEHVPFRDSKLTRILQSSLGGNARTAIICTMSPARSHVEQSRNTLLFASCAKEVVTNAHVNVVVSDKALVKQLQRELARLESELKNTRLNSVVSDSMVILREKDFQIEKLMKEVAELTRQLHHAHSQVQDLLQVAEDDRPSTIWAESEHHYPKLRVQNSYRSENSPSYSLISEDPHSLDAGVRSFDASQCSDGHRSSSSDKTFIQLADFEASFLQTNSSPDLSISTANFVGNDMGDNHTEEQTHENFDNICKEVQCIKVEESSTNRYASSKMSESSPNRYADCNTSSRSIKTGTTGSTEVRHEKIANQELGPPLKEPRKLNDSHPSIVPSPEKPFPWLLEVQCIKVKESSTNRYAISNISESSPKGYEDSNMSSPIKKTEMSVLTDIGNNNRANQELESQLKEWKEFNGLHSSFIIPSPEKPSPWPLEESIPGSRRLNLFRSRSCRARLVSNLPMCWLEKVENNESTPLFGFEKDFTGRPEGCQSQRKFSVLNYDLDIEMLLRNGSQILMGSSAIDELKVKSVETSSDWKSASLSNSDAGTMYLAVDLVQETKPKTDISGKNVKDVGLDPIQDDVENAAKWPSEFKRIQREIIELWHACNVSLVHRTYFFLLFKGDPTDSFYMEMELRRLSFVKDAFSRCNKNIVDGRNLTPHSSKRALSQERQMLRRQMQKRLSRDERENLFLKWGIALSSNNRRLQLVHRLWTKTTDMDHITESATLVAKLVGFEEKEQALKEMFGLLNITLIRPSRRKSSIWKRSVLALL